MKPELIEQLGRKAFVQSIHPYRGQILDSVAIFGLDSEFVPYDDAPSDLICWQLAGENDVKLFTKPLTLKNIYLEGKKMLNNRRYQVYVFVVFFALAELQFFNLNEWVVSEFKGKYRFSQSYGDGRLIITDLADWYPHEKLENVAKLWGYRKIKYPIAKKVTDIAKGKYTKEELLKESAFVKYALNDAVIERNIYVKMRQYFKDFNVDIVSTITPANTSASIFRLKIDESIEQKDAGLRKMALGCCWGGRMECIYRGYKERVFEYDATAHHPSSAIALEYLPLEKDWIRTQRLSDWMSGISGLGKVYFKFPDGERYPCLPVYDKDALIYPLEGISKCSVSEARLAVKLGAKLILIDGYYYQRGVRLLTEHLLELQIRRNNTKDKALRKLLKLLSNSIIGKFFQKKIGVDIAKVQQYAIKHSIPFEEAINLKDVDFGVGEAKVGSCFYPEWYGLILGYARANISEIARDHKAVMISSDSFITEEELGKTLEFGNVIYNLKEEGEYVGYRTRFYRVGKKLAHHAVHNKQSAQRVLKEFVPEGVFKYTYHRFIHLRESWKYKKAFGSRTMRKMTTDLGFDTKRNLNGKREGWSDAWLNVEEREKVTNIKEEL
jgi:hypothetical protein